MLIIKQIQIWQALKNHQKNFNAPQYSKNM